MALPVPPISTFAPAPIPSEEAIAVVERGKLLERIEERDRRAGEVSRKSAENLAQSKRPRAERGTKGQGVGGGRPVKAASDKAVAKMLSASEDTVRRRRKVAEAVGTDTLGQIVGSSLDSPAELAALADMPEPQRHELVERAAKGERVSARTDESDGRQSVTRSGSAQRNCYL